MSKAILPETFEGRRVVTAAEMSELDRRAAREFGLPSILLMENAGRGAAEETARFLREKIGREPGRSVVTICCGRGNKGGDGLVTGRYLKEAGAEVAAYIAPPRREGGYTPEVAENLKRAASAGVPVVELGEEAAALDVRLRSSDALIDALLGTGSAGKPAGLIRTTIQRMMKAGKPIVALDLPSGIHPDTGYHSGVFITAALTLTMGLPKRGLLAPHAKPNVGELKIVDIGLPAQLVQSTSKLKKEDRAS